MPNKLQAYAELAERTARQITGSHLAWTAFPDHRRKAV